MATCKHLTSFDVSVQKNVNFSQQELCTWFWHPSCTANCSFYLGYGMVPSSSQLDFIFRTFEGWGHLFCSGLKKKIILKSVSISANPTTQSKFFTGRWMDNMKWTFGSFKLFTFGTCRTVWEFFFRDACHSLEIIMASIAKMSCPKTEKNSDRTAIAAFVL